MESVSVKEGWLIVFDMEIDKPREEKITWETLFPENGNTAHILGC
jgi:hypothetical protein